MKIIADRINENVGVTFVTGTARRACEHVLAEIEGDGLLDFAERIFLERPIQTFIRECPTGAMMVVFRYNRDDEEDHLEVSLSNLEKIQYIRICKST